jgi:hypothetical protein
MGKRKGEYVQNMGDIYKNAALSLHATTFPTKLQLKIIFTPYPRGNGCRCGSIAERIQNRCNAGRN